jgi:geranylgeranyl reductase family protein
MDIDVAVVGAGPSGAWTARSLAMRGARVTIFDHSHPREKPCGGGVTGRAMELVADAVSADVPKTSIRSARFIEAARGTSVEVPLDVDELCVASRAVFDAGLLETALRAGASLVRERVTSVDVRADRVVVATRRGRYHAAVVVGADGANSCVRRAVAQPFRRDQISIATGFFAHGVTSDDIVIELVGDPPGYVWSFPRPDHLAVGICAQADGPSTAEALRARARTWIDAAGVARGARLEPYSWPIPSLSAADFASLTVAGPRWCLTGDAAGLVDPITREGIYFAIASGQWAADAIVSGDLQGNYTARVRDDAARELRCAAALKAGFFRPEFTSLMLTGLRESAAIRRVMADLVAGRQSYRTLKWRLARTLEIGLALRVLVARRSAVN